MGRGIQLDGRVLRSRVARRIFTVFLLCSLVPVVLFALFAYQRVRLQLDDDAAANLRSASKTAGMTILERLLIAEQALAILADGAAPDGAPLEGRLRVGDGRILEIAAIPPEDLDATLGAAQRAALAAGRTVLRPLPGAAPPARIEMLRRQDPARGDLPVIAASLDPDFVFEPRRRTHRDVYRVEDDRGRVLFSASPDPGADGEEPVARGAEIEADWELFLRSRFHAAPWTIAFSRPVAEVHRPLHQFEVIFPLVALAALGTALAFSLSQIRRNLVPIEELAEAARRVSAGELDWQVEVDSADEFGDLARTFNDMTSDLRRRDHVLDVVNDVGAALSSEQETTRLLDLILRGAGRVTEASGAVLFLSRDGGPLEQAGLWLESATAAEGGDPSLDPVVAARCRERRAPIFTSSSDQLGSAAEVAAWSAFEESLRASLGPRLSVPLHNGRDIVGVLTLFRRGSAPPFSRASCRLAESLASQAAIAIAKTQLADGFRALFEGVIDMTVRAIDEKSAYTGDHCRKVPILTEMIADAACAAASGPLDKFDLSEEERYELRIAALLHDCGKVVTPVHVMDKATKLETIFDRIELVDLRFDLVRRDLCGEPAPPDLEERLRRLEDDRAFLRRCNVGVEQMPAADRQRVREIASRYRYATAGGEEKPILSDEEVENLTIEHGTLNDAERRIIEQHVVSTIDLLNELPFPSWLAAVPEIAGSHHERTDGRGYPRGLHRHDITMQGRILGLADVFEALTAPDRPYKAGRTLSETLEILRSLRDEGALDADLHDLFVGEKVYLHYAVQHMRPEQIDDAHWEDVERLTSEL